MKLEHVITPDENTGDPVKPPSPVEVAEKFDITSGARREALEEADQALSEALTGIQNGDWQDPASENAVRGLNQAVRSIRQVVSNIDDLIRSMLVDLVVSVQAIATGEMSGMRREIAVEALRLALLEKEVLTAEEFDAIVRFKAMPQVIEKVRQGERKE